MLLSTETSRCARDLKRPQRCPLNKSTSPKDPLSIRRMPRKISLSPSTSQAFNAWKLTLTIPFHERNGTISSRLLKRHRVLAGSKYSQSGRRAQCHISLTCFTSYLRLRSPLIHSLSTASSLTSYPCFVRKRKEMELELIFQQTLLVDNSHKERRWKSSRSNRVSSCSQNCSSITASTSLRERTLLAIQPLSLAKFTSVAPSSCASTLSRILASPLLSPLAGSSWVS